MEPLIESMLNRYRRIEQLCEANHKMWEQVPAFRGAFSKFALRVSQLDLITCGEQFIQQITQFSREQIQALVKEIEQILSNHFDRYFSYVCQRNAQVYASYRAIRDTTLPE